MRVSEAKYKECWSWNKQTESWLRLQTKEFTLNICAGKSRIGTIRADIERKFKPHVVCDVKHLPFKNHSFDTVICDPPFSFYNRFKWVHKLAKLSRQRVILSHPLFDLYLGKGWERQFILTSEHAFFLRLWSIHDKRELNFESGAGKID